MLRQKTVWQGKAQNMVWDQRLMNNQHGMAKDLVLDFQDVYVKYHDDLSTTHADSHKMKLSVTGGVKQLLRLIPLSKRSDFKRELDWVDKFGVIECSSISWSSPLVLVTKKGGSLHTCVDFRSVNSLTIKDLYPLPWIDESMDTLQGSVWFCILHLSSRYCTVKTRKRQHSQPIWTLSFQRYAFRLGKCTSHFRKLMEKVLAVLNWEICLIHIDDIIISSCTFDEYVDQLREVFTRLREANLKVSSKKTHLFHQKVECLRFVVSNDGIATDPTKIEAITKWPTAQNVR